MLFQRNKPPQDPKALGQWGEKQARVFLEKQGLACVECNFKCRSGEIDLIMTQSDKTLVFVEVKTRASERHHSVESAITLAKKKRMTRAARYYVGIHELAHRPLRFDVITISLSTPGDIRHYPNAWVPSFI
jgi:putative endonuclease